MLSACSVRSQASVPLSADRASFVDALRTPVLIVTNGQANAIQYWPISPEGGTHPTTIARFEEISHSTGLASDGNVIAIGIRKPAQIVFFDARTGRRSSVEDPFGKPGAIVLDKSENLFALNDTTNGINVTMYPAGSNTPRQLTCATAIQAQDMAAHDEGDLIVVGYLSAAVKAVELPNGPNGLQSGKCTFLPLQVESDYVEDVTVDPKTDDLIVFHDPGFCAGPPEGRITIYPRPYDKKTAHSVDAGGTCPYGLFLNADSHSAFFIDSPLLGGQVVRQVTYPGGKFITSYRGSFPAEGVTIPNTLPN